MRGVAECLGGKAVTLSSPEVSLSRVGQGVGVTVKVGQATFRAGGVKEGTAAGASARCDYRVALIQELQLF